MIQLLPPEKREYDDVSDRRLDGKMAKDIMDLVSKCKAKTVEEYEAWLESF